MNPRRGGLLTLLLLMVLTALPVHADEQITFTPVKAGGGTPVVASDGRVGSVYVKTDSSGVSRVAYRIAPDFTHPAGPEVVIPLPAGFTQQTQPSVAVDARGNIAIIYVVSGPAGSALYATILPTQTTPGSTSLIFQAPGGATVVTQQAATDISPASSNTYVAAQVNSAGQSTGVIDVFRSTDGGATWSSPALVTPTSANNLSPSVAVDPATGTVYVTYTQQFGTAAVASVAVSTNGGLNFTSTPITTYFPGTLFGHQPISVGALSGNRSVVALTNCPPSAQLCQVEVSRSVNGGNTWSPPTAVSGGTLDQQFPRIGTAGTADPNYVTTAFFEKTGVGPLFDLFDLVSMDGGQTWIRNPRFNDQSVHLAAVTGSQGLSPLGIGVVPNVPWTGALMSATRGLIPGTAIFPVWTGLNAIGNTNIFTAGTPPGNILVAAVLPTSRSVKVGTAATAFVTVINTGTTPAIAVGITLITAIPATLTYQTTDAANVPTGTPNTPVDIPAGGSQTFVIALTPTAPFPPSDIALSFAGTNTVPVRTIIGVNTLLGSASATAVPDIVALAATLNNDGIVHITGASGTGVFAVATVNVGVGGSITVSADTGSASLPVSITLCQTDPVTGLCLATPATTVTPQIDAGATPTFGVFVTSTGVVPFDPANNRIFMRFNQGNVTRGSTSVAVRTDNPQ